MDILLNGYDYKNATLLVIPLHCSKKIAIHAWLEDSFLKTPMLFIFYGIYSITNSDKTGETSINKKMFIGTYD